MQLERIETFTGNVTREASSLLGDLLLEMTSFVMSQSEDDRARLLGFFHLADADRTSIHLATNASGKVILSLEADEDLPI